MTKETPTPSRRSFLRAGAATMAAGSAAVAMPHVARAKTKTLKIQAAWGGGIFLENAKSYVDRVHAMAGDALKIDLLPVNSVVKTSQMQDAVHRGVLDGAHYVPAYWYSKSKSASLFGTGPCFGWSSQEVLGWLHYGGGQQLFDELMGELGLNVVSMSVVQLPGGEIQPAMKSGLIDAAEFNNPTSDRDFGMQDVSKHYHLASFHQSQEFFEITFNKKMFDRLPGELQAILKHASEAENSNFYWHNTKRYAEDLVKLQDQGVNVYRTPDSVMKKQLEAWDIVVDRLSATSLIISSLTITTSVEFSFLKDTRFQSVE